MAVPYAVIVADVAETCVAVQPAPAVETPSGVVTSSEQTSAPLVANKVPVAVMVGSVPAGITVGLTLVTVG